MLATEHGRWVLPEVLIIIVLEGDLSRAYRYTAA